MKVLKNIEKINIKKTYYIILVILISFSVMLVCLGSWTTLNSYNPINKANILEFNEDWEFSVSNGESRPISLPIKSDIGENTPVTISKVLPSSFPQSWELCFRSSQQSVIVKIDNRIIYTYNTDGKRPFGKATPSGWNFVPISTEYRGKTIFITFNSPYKEYSGNINNIQFGNCQDLTNKLYQERLPSFFISIILLTIGFLLVIYTIVLKKGKLEYKPILNLGMFSILIALWLRSEAKVPQVFLINNFSEYILSFVSLMLCPIPFMLYLKEKFGKQSQKPLDFMCAAYILNFITLTTLQLFGICDFIETLIITHIWIIIGILLYIVLYIVNIKRHVIIYKKLELFGMVAFLFSVFCEIIIYEANGFANTGFLIRVGFLIFIICLIMSATFDVAAKAQNSITYFRELQESKAYMMVSQMQPHFIYNTLGAIRTMIMTSPNTAYKMTTDFTNYLRANIQALNSTEHIPFSKELEYITAYTEIEKVRFRNRLKVVFDIQADDFKVPPLTIQPIVENAIKHGICKKAKGGTVIVSSDETPDSYRVTVRDNGVGFDINTVINLDDSVSIGLKNIQYRLKSRINATIQFESEIGQGTTITVTIPKKEEDQY